MNKIWFSSDLHFNHDKEFVWKERGFSSVTEMNEAIVERFNSTIDPEDTLYLLGDSMMGDLEAASIWFNKLTCKNIIMIYGNHDSNTRIKFYANQPEKIKCLGWADIMTYKKKMFHLSHWPTAVVNDSKFFWNLHGHTHSTEKFNEIPCCYNVAVDAHNCYPVCLDTIIEDIFKKIDEEKEVKENETV